MEARVSLDDPDLDHKLEKSDTLEKIDFEAHVNRSVQAIFKANDDFVIWGPASVEIVDKEGDQIRADALDKALPQLLKRARLSLEHTDQVVGRILESFKTNEPVSVEVNGHTYKRQEFPTDVLEFEKDDKPPALYVAGEVYDDTQQAQKARKRIEDGELTSYSISGEALVTQKEVGDDGVYDDIVELDLSAVTLCEEGMNQEAGYAKVEGEVDDKTLAGEARKEDEQVEKRSLSVTSPETGGQNVNKNMSGDNTGGSPSLEDVLKRLPEEGEVATKTDMEKAAAEKAREEVRKRLPKGDLATKSYVESLVKREVEKYWNEGTQDPMEGQSDPSDGEGFSDDPESYKKGTIRNIVNDVLDAKEEMEDEEEYEEDEEEYEEMPPEDEKGENGDDGEDDDDEDEVPPEFREEEDEKQEDGYEEEEPPELRDDEEEEEEEEVPPLPEEDEEGEVVEMSQLEAQLPADVFDVVKEYLGKRGGSATQSQVEKAVRNVMEEQKSGSEEVSGASGPGQDTGAQAEAYEKSDDGISGESPALDQFYG